MRIWFQTATSYRYEPVYDEYGKTLEEQCRRVVRPDTEVYVTGLPVHLREGDRYKSVLYYHMSQNMNNMLKAEKEGYDAFVIGCSFEFGMDEGREMLNIPVVGMTHTNLHMAAMLGELFAIVTSTPYTAEKYRQMIARYGLQSKHLRGNYIFPVVPEEWANALKDPEPVAEKFKVVARRAIADGASVIIPTPAFISGVFYKIGGLTSLDGALILDPVAVAVKFAEMMVDLKKIGIEVSRKLQVYGSPGKELLDKILETYAPVFKIDY